LGDAAIEDLLQKLVLAGEDWLASEALLQRLQGQREVLVKVVLIADRHAVHVNTVECIEYTAWVSISELREVELGEQTLQLSRERILDEFGLRLHEGISEAVDAVQ